MNSISFGIMSVPERRTMRKKLIEQLGGYKTIGHETLRFLEAIDYAHRGPWSMAKRLWENADPEATHHLIIQDDAWPVDDFWIHIKRAIEAAPDSVLCLYGRGPAFIRANERDEHFVSTHAPRGVGLLVPASITTAMLEWAERMLPKEITDDDIRVGLYCDTHDLTMLATVPSLVDHLETESFMGHGIESADVFQQQLYREKWEVPARLGRDGSTFHFSNRILPYLRRDEPVTWPPQVPWRGFVMEETGNE